MAGLAGTVRFAWAKGALYGQGSGGVMAQHANCTGSSYPAEVTESNPELSKTRLSDQPGSQPETS